MECTQILYYRGKKDWSAAKKGRCEHFLLASPLSPRWACHPFRMKTGCIKAGAAHRKNIYLWSSYGSLGGANLLLHHPTDTSIQLVDARVCTLPPHFLPITTGRPHQMPFLLDPHCYLKAKHPEISHSLFPPVKYPCHWPPFKFLSFPPPSFLVSPLLLNHSSCWAGVSAEGHRPVLGKARSHRWALCSELAPQQGCPSCSDRFCPLSSSPCILFFLMFLVRLLTSSLRLGSPKSLRLPFSICLSDTPVCFGDENFWPCEILWPRSGGWWRRVEEDNLLLRWEGKMLGRGL